MRTRDKLASELRKMALLATPDNAVKYEAFAARAETGEFDYYADTYVRALEEAATVLERQPAPVGLETTEEERDRLRVKASRAARLKAALGET